MYMKLSGPKYEPKDKRKTVTQFHKDLNSAGSEWVRNATVRSKHSDARFERAVSKKRKKK